MWRALKRILQNLYRFFKKKKLKIHQALGVPVPGGPSHAGWDSADATSPSLLRRGALLLWARLGGGFLQKKCPVEEVTP